MFTGIIERTAIVRGTETRGRMKVVTLAKPASWKLKKGQSVSVSGICSTVVASTSTSFTVEYMPETLRTTIAGTYIKGRVVNLERSLKYGERMDGHFVQGHIEGTARVAEKKKEGRSTLLTLRFPAILARYALARGSVTLDGVALTVAKRHGPRVSVALVPHTQSHTTLGKIKIGEQVNVETDLLVRHARVTTHAKKPLRKSR